MSRNGSVVSGASPQPSASNGRSFTNMQYLMLAQIANCGRIIQPFSVVYTAKVP